MIDAFIAQLDKVSVNAYHWLIRGVVGSETLPQVFSNHLFNRDRAILACYSKGIYILILDSHICNVTTFHRLNSVDTIGYVFLREDLEELGRRVGPNRTLVEA